jgi:molybdate transport system ATP-binding protein
LRRTGRGIYPLCRFGYIVPPYSIAEEKTAPMQPIQPNEPAPRVAALRIADGVDVDGVIRRAIDILRARGLSVGGVVQCFGPPRPSGKRTMLVQDIQTGELVPIDQDLGPGALTCTLDPEGLAVASVILCRAIAAPVDVLVVNRFGKLEAAGEGLRADVAEALCAGLPVLIAVKDSLMPDWRAFIGEDVHLLAPDADLVAEWAWTNVARSPVTA